MDQLALRPRCCAMEAEVSTRAAPPSVMGDAFPAVTVPGSIPSEKAGLSCWSLSCLNLLGASSLSTIVGDCPFLAGNFMGTISCNNRGVCHAQPGCLARHSQPGLVRI